MRIGLLARSRVSEQDVPDLVERRLERRCGDQRHGDCALACLALDVAVEHRERLLGDVEA